MPPIVAAIAAVVVAVGSETALVTLIGIGGLQTIGSVVGTVLVTGALSMATTYISKAFAPKASDPGGGNISGVTPSDGQQTTRDPVSARWKHYGQVKIGGSIIFYESRDGEFYVGIAHGQGEITEFLEHWLNDLQVTIDSNGFVQEAKYQNSSRTINGVYVYGSVATLPTVETTTSRVRLINHRGSDDQIADALLHTVFPDSWTVDHRLRGVAWTLAVYGDVPNADFANMYRGGAPTYRAVVKGSAVYDWRTGATAWSDNPALCIRDFLVSNDGLRTPVEKINEESFAYGADVCDELIDLSGSAVEKRYRLWGSYQLTEEPVKVLERMLAPCAGELYVDSEGLICLHVGEWVDPDVCLDADKGHIIAYDMSRGPDMFSKVNTIKTVFTYPDNDYQETDGDPWVNVAERTLDGDQLEDKLELYTVPSHTQTRRLAKIHYYKANPKWIGKIMTNLYGLQTINERVVILNIPELGIAYEPFYIIDRQLGEDGCTLNIDVIAADKNGYVFSQDEEGTLPRIPDSPNGATDGSLQPPSRIRVVAGKPVGGGPGVCLYVIWEDSTRDSTSHIVRYNKPTEAPTDDSIAALINYDITSAVTPGSIYEVRVKTIGSGGLTSPYSAAINVVATVNNVSAGSCTGLSVTKGVGNTGVVKWTTPVTDEFVMSKLYRGVTNNFAEAVVVNTKYSNVGAQVQFLDSLSPGTYYYWVVAYNSSNVSGGAVGPVAFTL